MIIFAENILTVWTSNFKLNIIQELEELVNMIRVEFEALVIGANLQIEKAIKLVHVRNKTYIYRSSSDLEYV